MTKKEKEEMAKRNKNKNIAIFVLVVLLIAVIAFFLFKEGVIDFSGKGTTAPDTTNSVSDTVNDYPNNDNNNVSIDNENETKEDETDETTSEEDTEDNGESEKKNENDGKVYAASLPLTDNDAIAILKSRYGSGYRINRTSQNGANTNYAVYKDEDRYASVSVNLSTGEATEYIIDTGKQTSFNLL
ncbi:MAG: hypothetical protein K2I73_07565 [Eubacterium sp.]|nr:hypothetical protein [Eubacterium sp.]